MSEPLIYWQGRPVEDLTRAELIQALIESNELSLQNSKEHLRQLTVIGKFKKPIKWWEFWK